MNKSRICYVIMPFQERYVLTYKEAIRPAINKVACDRKEEWSCLRSDDIHVPGSITKEIVTSLHTADLVIADLTGYNPNVFYELGVVHSAGRPTITSIPLETDSPVDAGIAAFCDHSRACRIYCPADAVPDERDPAAGKDHLGYDRYVVDTGRCFPYFAKHYYCSICLPVCVYNHREWARDFEGFQTGWFPEVVMTNLPRPPTFPKRNGIPTTNSNASLRKVINQALAPASHLPLLQDLHSHQRVRARTTLGCANQPGHPLRIGGNETSGSWWPMRSNRAARVGGVRHGRSRHLPAPDRNKRSPAGPSPRAARCHCEFARRKSHHRSDRSTSLAHPVPPPSMRQVARCAAGGIRG